MARKEHMVVDIVDLLRRCRRGDSLHPSLCVLFYRRMLASLRPSLEIG
jgi:hypothetical protein